MIDSDFKIMEEFLEVLDILEVTSFSYLLTEMHANRQVT